MVRRVIGRRWDKLRRRWWEFEGLAPKKFASEPKAIWGNGLHFVGADRTRLFFEVFYLCLYRARWMGRKFFKAAERQPSLADRRETMVELCAPPIAPSHRPKMQQRACRRTRSKQRL